MSLLGPLLQQVERLESVNDYNYTIILLYLIYMMMERFNFYAEGCKWMSSQSCLDFLLEVKPSSDRVGPLVVVGLLNDLLQSKEWRVPPNLQCQVIQSTILSKIIDILSILSNNGRMHR